MTEVYWMALARDIPFTKFATDPLIAAAAGKGQTKTMGLSARVYDKLGS